MKKLLPLATALGLLAGCATPEASLRTGLIDAGLSRKQSTCMADQMADKLSIGQLLKLRSLKNFSNGGVRDMSMTQFLRNVRALEDPEIVSITGKAALGCAILG